MTDTRALLIGNWEYDDPDKILLPLVGPERDVELMLEALVHEHFGLCKQSAPTVHRNLIWSQIGEKLLDFIAPATPDQHLIIYYSGHGERLAAGQLGLCGVDTKHHLRNAQTFDTTQLRSWLETQCRAKSVIVVLDCCYAGQMKGSETDELDQSFGRGTVVLASSGNTAVPAAPRKGEASPFTGALHRVLTDSALQGNASGYLDAAQVFQFLQRVDPPLSPKPRLKADNEGSLPLALRPVPPVDEAGPVGLKDWVDDRTIELHELEFGPDGVRVVGNGEHAGAATEGPLDLGLCVAIRRLGQLADALMRHPEFQDRPVWQRAVRRTWDCVGTALLQGGLPPPVRHRLAELDHTGKRVIKLRLSFPDGGRELEGYPWEYMQLPPVDDEEAKDDLRLPLALRNGMLIERRGRAQGVERRRSPSSSLHSVAVWNCFQGSYMAAGKHIAARLDNAELARVVQNPMPREATWGGFVESLNQRPDHLVLLAPVRRQSATAVDIGFASDEPNEPVWQPASELLAAVREASLQFASLIFVTFSTPPGEDAMRGTIDIARRLADGSIGEVAFVCHGPGYLGQYTGDNETFPSLLIDALSHDKAFDEAVYYARSRVVKVAPQNVKSTFGAPGFYGPPDTARSSAKIASGPGLGSTSPSAAPMKAPASEQQVLS